MKGLSDGLAAPFDYGTDRASFHGRRTAQEEPDSAMRWEKKSIGDLGNFLKGKGVKKDEAGSGPLPCVRYGELYNMHENVIRNFKSFIGPDVAKNATPLEYGDVLFAGSGETKEDIGKCAAFAHCGLNAYAGGDIIILRSEGADPVFLGYLLNLGKIQAEKASRGQGDAIVHIGAAALSEIEIAIPADIKEQVKIGELISDADTLIHALEKLIAKKRLVKEGMMQDLLTGKRRLPGFGKKWTSRKLKDVCRLRKEKTNLDAPGADKFCVELENIEKATGRLTGSTSGEEQSSDKFVFEEGDVLFGRLRAYQKKHWLADRIGVCSTEIWVLAAREEEIYNRYLYYTIAAEEFSRAAGTVYGTHMPRSDWAVVQNFMLLTPPSDEQTAIASVLSDMDAEIASLEAKLAKTRLLKQGMMQDLLTGRVRLI